MGDDWFERAACRGMDVNVFFPTVGRHGPSPEAQHDLDKARAVCASCPVIDDCGDYARRNRLEGGVWAGRLRSPYVRRRDDGADLTKSTYAAAERAEAVALTDRIGLNATHRRTGISVNALKRWRAQRADDAPAVEPDEFGPSAA